MFWQKETHEGGDLKKGGLLLESYNKRLCMTVESKKEANQLLGNTQIVGKLMKLFVSKGFQEQSH